MPNLKANFGSIYTNTLAKILTTYWMVSREASAMLNYLKLVTV